MPIKRLQMHGQPEAFPCIGKLRKGGEKQKKVKDGREYEVRGRDLDHFRFDTDDQKAAADFAAAYGAEPKSITVFLPYATPDENFRAWLEEYGAGSLKRRCDGELMDFHRDAKTGIGSNTPKPCEKACGLCKCDEVGRLSIIIRELVRFAYVTVETHSIYDIVEITANLRAAYAMSGDLRKIQFVLSRRDREISTPTGNGQRVRMTKSLLFLEPDPAWVERKMLAMQQESYAMLPEVSGVARPLLTMGGVTVDSSTGEIVSSIPERYEGEGNFVAQEPPPQADDNQPPSEPSPFDDATVGATADANANYAAMRDTLTGKCSQLATWAAGLHASATKPATDARYKFLAGKLDKAAGADSHRRILSVLIGRYVSAQNPIGDNLAAKLLDAICDERQVKDAEGKFVKGQYEKNPDYRQDVVDCLVSLAKIELIAAEQPAGK